MKATTTTSTINSGARVAESTIDFTNALIGVTEIELESLEIGEDDHHSGGDSDDDSDYDGEDDDGDDSDEGENHHEGEFEIEYQGQFVVDLIAGTSDPDFGIADLIPGTYKEIPG